MGGRSYIITSTIQELCIKFKKKIIYFAHVFFVQHFLPFRTYSFCWVESSQNVRAINFTKIRKLPGSVGEKIWEDVEKKGNDFDNYFGFDSFWKENTMSISNILLN